MKRKSKKALLADRRCRDRRRNARKFCPKCFTMARVTNEVYGGDGRKQTGWEWDCPWCRFHWHEYVNGEGKLVKERLSLRAMRWIKM